MKKKIVKNLPLIGLGVCAVALAGSMFIHKEEERYTIRRWWIDPETGIGGWVE